MKKLLLLLALVTLSSGLWAEVVEKLYQIQVPVEQRSDSNMRRAAAEGLQAVLIRVSGRTDVVQSGAIQEALRKARDLLTQYSYQEKLVNGKQQLFLRLDFNEQEVNRLLSQSGQPVWDKNRPETLVWLAIDDIHGRRFVSAADDPEVIAALNAAAEQRGLPLVFPVLDIDDKLQLSAAQVWSMDVTAIRQAAERYRASRILSGRLIRLSTGWIGNFALISPSENSVKDVQGRGLADVISPAIDTLADELASTFSVVRSAHSPLEEIIYVRGIDNFRDYARLLTYLEGVAVIEHANPVWVSGSNVAVMLYLQGAMEKAQQFFRLDKKLVEEPRPILEPDPVPEESPGIELNLPEGSEGIDATASDVPKKESRPAQIPANEIHSYYRWQ